MRRRILPLIVALALGGGLSAPARAAQPNPQVLLQEGRNDEAKVGFETMANRHPDDARWRYNAGVAAFRAGDAATAQRHFEAATAASDLALQQRAWYNLGNAWFQLANAPDAEDREATLRKSEEAFEAAAQLTPQDRHATENLAAVRKLAEELRKQQDQQQPQQDPQKQKDPKSKDSKNQKSKNQKGQKGQDGKSEKSDDASQDPDAEQASKPGDTSSPKDQAKKDRKKNPSQDPKSGERGSEKDKDQEKGQQPDVAQQPTNAPSAGNRTNQTAQAGKDRDKDKGKDKGKSAAEADKGGIQRGEGSDAPGAEGQASMAEAAERMTVVQAQQMLDAQKGSEKPIWTLVRNWGQENTAPPSGSNRKKSW